MLNLLKIFFVLFLSICINAQTDPNIDPNWDWINGDYPAAPYPSTQYKMYIEVATGVIQALPRNAPWGQGNAWVGLQDMKKEDGWVIVARDFGTPWRPIFAMDQQGSPYFVLYNKFKGIMRFFILVRTNQELTSGAIELRFNNDNVHKTATLTHLKPRAYASDKVQIVKDNLGSALSTVMNSNWSWADFPMAYDPTIVASENGAWLDFRIIATTEADIKINGTATGINGTQKAVRDFMTGTSSGAVTLSESMPEIGQPKNLGDLGTKLLGTASNWGSWKGTLEDFYKKLPNFEDANPISVANNNLKLAVGRIKDNWLLEGLPFISSAVGLVDFLFGGGKKTDLQNTAPTFSGFNITLNGTISTNFKLPNPKRIQVPSSKLNPNIAVFGSTTPIIYNENIGILNLTTTPVLKYKTYMQSYPNGDGRGYMDFQVQDNLNISVNPASGLILDSCTAWIVVDPSKTLNPGPLNLNQDLNLLALWTLQGITPKLELESSVDGKFTFRSVPVPFDAFKYQRIQGPYSSQSSDITIKIKAVLHRIDDANAQPVLVVLTYEPDLVADGQGNYAQPFYVKVTREFEFDQNEVQPVQFGFGTQNILITTPATIGSYTFMGWSDGSISTNRVFTQSTDVKAIYKNVSKSNNALAFSKNSQRKMVRTIDGQLHRVYESMGKCWYERSTDNGVNWTIVGGKPISIYNSLSPSIDYYQNYICIAYQENHIDKFDIRILFFQNGDQLGSSKLVKGNSSNLNAFDAAPVVALDVNNNILVIWRDEYQSSVKLNYRFGAAFGNSWHNLINPIPNTDIYSINPTLTTKKNGTGIKYQLAYQLGDTEIRYLTLSGINNEIEFSSLINISSQSPYTKNYKPSLVVLNINGTESVRFSWIGERSNYAVADEEVPTDVPYFTEKRTVFRALSGTVLSSYWNFGLGVSSTSINGTDDNNYIVGWSQNSGMQNQYVRNTTLSQVKSFNKNNNPLIGSDLQVANGSNFATQFATIFNSSTLPYQFSTSDAVSILGKVTGADKINTGREGIVTKDSAHFYFSLGDITVNNSIIDFPPIEDTVLFSSTNHLNDYLVSVPFQLENQSSFSYSVQYGVTDSIIASTILSQGGTLMFKVQLVDELTNEILGTYDEVIFSSENPIVYDNIAYEVNVNGIGSRLVRLKLIVTSTLDALYNLATKYATENQLAKKNPKRIYFNGQEVVDNYALAQNYPNPFNPVTKIRYQIPQSGFVLLKIYDILGAEITTLVNEERHAGQYEVDFNASKFASGVYIYRIQAGDFVSSKKMILLK